MKKLTIELVDRIFRATGVNILLLTPDEWRHTNPLAQRMLVQEYLQAVHKMDGSDGIHVPDNFVDLLSEAINYFFTPLTPQGSGAKTKSS